MFTIVVPTAQEESTWWNTPTHEILKKCRGYRAQDRDSFKHRDAKFETGMFVLWSTIRPNDFSAGCWAGMLANSINIFI